MKIKRFIGGTLESNGFILNNGKNSDCYIIDPGYNSSVFLKFISEENLNLKGILLTHYHYDHVGAAKKIASTKDCSIYLHREDLDMYEGLAEPIEDGEVFSLGNEKIEVIHTPGHSKGGVCFYLPRQKAVFVGDTIFNVDLGRTDLEGGNQKELEFTIKNIIDKWENDIVIYPGHGDSCNMKYVRKHNQEYIDIINNK